MRQISKRWDIDEGVCALIGNIFIFTPLCVNLCGVLIYLINKWIITLQVFEDGLLDQRDMCACVWAYLLSTMQVREK